MEILVLANNDQKEELLALPVSTDANIRWATSLPETGYSPDACIDLLFENKTERIQALQQLRANIVVVNAVADPLREIETGFIRINGWNTFLRRPVAELACIDKKIQRKTGELFSFFGRTVEWVPDVSGLVTPRIIATIINEAFIALDEKVSVEEEIDTAMKLGTNYPFGPFEWAEKIGHANVFHLLNSLSKKEKRYLPSQLLKQKALA